MKMAQIQLKSTIEQLNSLLGKNFNLISFDNLKEHQLLQLLSDVLGEIDKNNKIDINQEELEETAIRILEMLRILKYRITPGMSVSAFRNGLIQGDKHVIHPIIEWLLNNIEVLQKRSYLAQYLVKLEIPSEMLANPDIAHLYEQYESNIEDFKNTHKKYVSLKQSGLSVTELKTDIGAMEKEKDIVEKKIEKLQQRIENVASKSILLKSAKVLREEKDKEKELFSLIEQQKSQLIISDQKIKRLQMQLKELKQLSIGASVERLLRRLEEECRVNNYMATQKLPQEIQNRQMEVKILETVIREPNFSPTDIDDLNNKIQQINAEINQMVERHLATQNPGEDKNAPFRQQASIITKKKQNKAEQLSDLKNTLCTLEDELKEKQIRLKELCGDTILKGEEFKTYVNKLKGRSVVYKQKRLELSALKTETGILTRTLEVLGNTDGKILDDIENRESQHGMLGYHKTIDNLDKVSEEKADVNSRKGKTLEEMSNLVLQLSQSISAKKSQLAPLINELRSLRSQFQELSEEYDQKKKIYDATALSLDNSTLKLQHEVEKLKTDVNQLKSDISTLEEENSKAKDYAVKVSEELKIYVSGNSESRKQSVREQLNQKINEQEKFGRQLKEEQKAVKEDQAKRSLQIQYWKEFESLMECKKRCFEESRKGSGIVRREKGAETLILS